MKVSWLYPGLALKVKKGVYVGDSSRQNARLRFLTLSKDMGWWNDFYPGESEVLIYVGEQRSDQGRLLREVLWRGVCRCIRPYDWRYFELLEEDEDSAKIL